MSIQFFTLFKRVFSGWMRKDLHDVTIFRRGVTAGSGVSCRLTDPVRFICFPGILICLLFSFQTRAGIVVLNGLTHENRALSGETYRGTIQVQNTEKKGRSVRVYQRDYWFSFTGESRHDAGGTLERSNAEWISYNPEMLTLDSAEMATINFEVRVPSGDSLRGTYWSVIMVEGITPPDTIKPERGVKINTAVRYAVQVITHIGATGVSDMQFIGLELTRRGGKNVLQVALENTGERILKPTLNLELFDDGGNAVGTVYADQRKTFPGTSVLSTLILEGIKPGSYTGVLIADCGEDRLFGTNLSLDIE